MRRACCTALAPWKTLQGSVGRAGNILTFRTELVVAEGRMCVRRHWARGLARTTDPGASLFLGTEMGRTRWEPMRSLSGGKLESMNKHPNRREPKKTRNRASAAARPAPKASAQVIKRGSKKDPVPVNLKPVMNLAIKDTTIRVTWKDEDGKGCHKVCTRDEGLELAQSMGMDLILATANATPPVCKIADYATERSLRYNQVKAKKRASTKRKTETKEVRLRGMIAAHDLDVKMKQANNFLERGDRVRVRMIAFPRQLLLDPNCLTKVYDEVIARLPIDQVVVTESKLAAGSMEEGMQREVIVTCSSLCLAWKHH
ncbi:unnamed protein product [Chrysoparadoxa australica]